MSNKTNEQDSEQR
jgi:predicted ATPase